MAKISVMFGTEVQGEYTLEKDEHSVGRATTCDIVVDNLGVSRHHCSIVRENDGWAVEDKGSNNGTFVGGQKVTKQTLKSGDRVVLGKHSLVFDPTGVASTAAKGKKGPAGMGGEMTMFVDQQALAKAMANEGKRMVISLVQGGREMLVQLLKDETTIGTQADVPVRGFLVKKIQARIVRMAGGHRLINEGGWRAVKVNGVKIHGQQDLKAGDLIVIANTRFTYKPA